MENEKQTLGGIISAKRRELGMTQLELAEKMGVTDKAVSKWERDLSCPDIYSLPRLAEIFNVSVDELLQAKKLPKAGSSESNVSKIINGALRGVALAGGVYVTVMTVMSELGITEFDAKVAITLLGLGLFSLTLYLFRKDK